MTSRSLSRMRPDDWQPKKYEKVHRPAAELRQRIRIARDLYGRSCAPSSLARITALAADVRLTPQAIADQVRAEESNHQPAAVA